MALVDVLDAGQPGVAGGKKQIVRRIDPQQTAEQVANDPAMGDEQDFFCRGLLQRCEQGIETPMEGRQRLPAGKGEVRTLPAPGQIGIGGGQLVKTAQFILTKVDLTQQRFDNCWPGQAMSGA